MIAKMGYPAETHEVITEDGYILQMHRIPFGKKSPLVEGVEKPVVFLQHGIVGSSADYVMGIPEKSLGELTYPIVHEQGNKTIGKLDCEEQIATRVHFTTQENKVCFINCFAIDTYTFVSSVAEKV
jgi:hypothetical protein